MLTWLSDYCERPLHRVIGLMSGTSADGIDAAWVDIMGSGDALQATLRHHTAVPYSSETKHAILEVCRNGTTAAVARLNVELGELFAGAVLQLARESGLPIDSFHLIGSHGQTVSHQPDAGASLQIGEPCVIAERTGVTTVADFRPRDLAAGGQGAPLVPYVDYCLLRDPVRHRIVQNVGGIANCTVLPAGGSLDDVRAWDTGPGNMLMDAAIRHYSDGALECDHDGAMAARGRVDEGWLQQLLAHPFLAQQPPKSAGREQFGAAYAVDFVDEAARRGLTAEDAIATATALTAASIADSYRRYAGRLFEAVGRQEAGATASTIDVILGGGGTFNSTLRQMLGERLTATLPAFQWRLLAHEDVGIPSQAKESMAFAILAHATIMGVAGNVPFATGARSPVVLGKIVPGPHR